MLHLCFSRYQVPSGMYIGTDSKGSIVKNLWWTEARVPFGNLLGEYSHVSFNSWDNVLRNVSLGNFLVTFNIVECIHINQVGYDTTLKCSLMGPLLYM